MTTITALPTPPSTSDPANFDTRADAFLAALPTFRSEVNTVAGEVNTNATTATTGATTATAQATTATNKALEAANSAAAAAASAGATLWVTGTNYTAPAVVISPTNFAAYRTTTSGTSSTDPAADTSGRWVSAMLPSAEALSMPTVRPVLLFDFLNSGHIDPRLTIGRASTKSRTGPNGKVQTLPAHAMAVEYNGATGAERGLLVERAATNLVTYSAAIDNAAWTKVNTTITTSAGTSPDGSANACKVVPSASNANHHVYQAASASAPMVVSLRAAAAGYNWLRLDFGGGGRCAYFNLSTGAVGTTVGGVTATIKPIGPSGWYECSISHPSTYDGFMGFSCGAADNFGFSYSADGASGVLVWGAQAETGSLSSSYIATAGATASRSADRVALAGPAYTNAIGSNEMTVLVALDYRGIHTESRGLVELANAARTHEIVIDIPANYSNVRGYVYTAGAVVATFSAALTVGRNVVALAVAADNVAFVTAGTAVQTDSVAAMPLVNSDGCLGGVLSAAGYEYNDAIELVAIYNKRISNAELQALVNNA